MQGKITKHITELHCYLPLLIHFGDDLGEELPELTCSRISFPACTRGWGQHLRGFHNPALSFFSLILFLLPHWAPWLPQPSLQLPQLWFLWQIAEQGAKAMLCPEAPRAANKPTAFLSAPLLPCTGRHLCKIRSDSSSADNQFSSYMWRCIYKYIYTHI